MPRKTTVALAAVALVASLTACDDWKNANGHGDAEVQSADTAGAEVINMPDTFGNLATKCSHGNRVYSTTHGSTDDKQEYASQIWILPNDPSCVKEENAQ